MWRVVYLASFLYTLSDAAVGKAFDRVCHMKTNESCESVVADPMERFDEYIYWAKLAEQSQRYDDMAKQMERAITLKKKLDTAEQRRLMEVAFRTVVEAKRSSWRVVSIIATSAFGKQKAIRRGFQMMLKHEISFTCNTVLNLLEQYLMSNAEDSAVKVFYLTLCGDYYRYLVEISEGVDVIENRNSAETYYESAHKTAVRKLNKAHPILLGLVLKFSMFYLEILNSPKRAFVLAHNAVVNAKEKKGLNQLTSEQRQESSLLLQLLQNKLTLLMSTGAGEMETGAHQ